MSTPYIITHDSLTVFLPEGPLTVHKDTSNYAAAIEALKAKDEDALVAALQPARKVVEFLGTSEARIIAGEVHFRGQILSDFAAKKAVALLEEGLDPQPLLNFIDRVRQNPSSRSVRELYPFLERGNLPLTDDGCFLAYKRVKADFKDVHSNTFTNSPGSYLSMPRNEVDDDCHRTCSYGFHVCSKDYLRHFGGNRLVVVKVDPADVVSIPTDYDSTKARVCAYEVLYEIPLPDDFSRSFEGELTDPVVYDDQEEDRAEWRKAVAEGRTELSFADWLADKEEEEEEEEARSYIAEEDDGYLD